MYLLDETHEAAEMRRHIVDLLLTCLPENVKLACQLIEGGGMCPQFVLPLWIATHQRTQDADFQARWQARLLAYAPPFAELDIFAHQYLHQIPFEKIIALQKQLTEFFGEDFSINYFIRTKGVKITPQKILYFDYFYTTAPETRPFLMWEKALGERLSSLTYLPADVGEFPEWEKIDISHAQIKGLPAEFYTLHVLRSPECEGTPLHADENRLKEIIQKMPLLYASMLCEEAEADRGKKEQGDALEKVRRAVEICPEDAEIWFSYGAVHRDAGDQQGAVEGFSKVRALQPEEHYICYHLAWAQAESGLTAEALETIDAYIAGEGEDGDVYFMPYAYTLRAQCCEAFGRYEEAITAGKLAYEYEDMEWVLREIARMYGLLGKKTEMLAYLRRAFEEDWARAYPVVRQNLYGEYGAYQEDADFQALLAEFNRES